MLHLVKWNLVHLRKEGTLWTIHVYTWTWLKEDKQVQPISGTEIANFHCILIRWRSLYMRRKLVYCHYNFLEHPRTSELNFIAVHGHMILILKSDVCSAYMSIHTHEMMASSIFIANWFIRNLYVFIHWDYDRDIWLYTKFKSNY